MPARRFVYAVPNLTLAEFRPLIGMRHPFACNVCAPNSRKPSKALPEEDLINSSAVELFDACGLELAHRLQPRLTQESTHAIAAE